jgi:hypothetical protein
MGLNTTPRTWVAGEKPPASTWNTEIRDALTGIQAAWTSYTPTLTNVTLGNGTLAGAYLQIGKTIHYRALLTFGSTTVVSGSIQFALPVAANANQTGGNYPLGISTMKGTSSTVYGWARMLASNTGIAPVYNTAATTSSDCTATAPYTWASTNFIFVQGVYEAA